MSDLVPPNMANILLPVNFKPIQSDSESDTEDSSPVTIPFKNLTEDFEESVDIKSDVSLVIIDAVEIKSSIESPCSMPALTPTKSSEEFIIDPVTPTANLKILMNVLSPEIRQMEKRNRFNNLVEVAVKSREENIMEMNDSQMECPSQGEEENDKNICNRKAKSLGLLCQKFLSRYPDYPEGGQVLPIPLDTVSKELNVERRRIYDIVNVLESVEMVSRRAKNKYVWHGRVSLLTTLKRLQEIGEKEYYGVRMAKLRQLQLQSEFDVHLKPLAMKQPLKDSSNHQNTQTKQKCSTGEDKSDSRKEKSLGVMSQKFIMLFLVSKDTRLISLDDAAKVLIGDEHFQIDESAKLKTKVRRLYDIANILTSLNLITKVHVIESRGRKPAFKWIGPYPKQTQISSDKRERRPVTKHSLLTSSPCSSSGKVMWGRHASFNAMVNVVEKETKAYSSAPNSPIRQDHCLDGSTFQAEFEALKRKYPAQVSSLVSAGSCNLENTSPNVVLRDAITPDEGLNKAGISKCASLNGVGPCRALFGANNNDFLISTKTNNEKVAEDGPGTSEGVAASVNQDAKQNQHIFKQSSSEALVYQPPVKKSKTVLQQHGYSRTQLEDLLKDGKTVKVVCMYPNTSSSEQATKTYIQAEKMNAVKQTSKLDPIETSLVCKESISPLYVRSIKGRTIKHFDTVCTNTAASPVPFNQNEYISSPVDHRRKGMEFVTSGRQSLFGVLPPPDLGFKAIRIVSPVLYQSTSNPNRLAHPIFPQTSRTPDFNQSGATTSLLNALTNNLTQIQPTTEPNPYITPPCGSIIRGVSLFNQKLPVQRQLSLSKTPKHSQ